MLKYILNKNADDELLTFYQCQKEYLALEKAEASQNYVVESLAIPEGYNEGNHYFYRVYDHGVMVGIIDYIIGYRFSKQYDDKYVWLGLFMVDEKMQHLGYGRKMFSHFLKMVEGEVVQLGCIKDNYRGMAFWQKLGFKVIDEVKMADLDLFVLEMKMNWEELLKY